MMFAIKAEVSDPWAETFAFSAQKTMYGGKHIAKGDTIFVFASENEGGPGAWVGARSNFFPTGTTAGPRPSSISNSIVRQQTRSSASRMKRRRSSADSFKERISILAINRLSAVIQPSQPLSAE